MGNMARAAVVAALGLLAAATHTHADTNIEQGFALDGATTYCQGVKGGGGGGGLGLMELAADSTGKCPVGVALTMTATTFKQKDNIDVTWKAKAVSGLATNKFPSAVDAVTKIPKGVVSSLIKACKAGTNCGAVIDSVPTGPANAETGVFDATGTKEMRAARFSFSDVGEFIIVAKVVLPGDASLNISATEFIAFRKISVVDVNTPIAPSPSPTPAASPSPTPAAPGATPAPAPKPSAASGSSKADSQSSKNESGASNEANVILPSDSGAGTVKPGSDEIASSTPTPSKGDGSSSLDASTSSSKGIFGSNSVLLGCVFAGCFVVFVMGFAFVMRRRTENKMMTEKSIDNAPDGSVGMLDSGDFGAAAVSSSKYVASKSARNRGASPKMSISPPIVLDASVRGSEMDRSTDEYQNMSADHYQNQQRDVSEVSSLASEMYSDTMSNFDDSSRDTDDHNLGSFDWKDSEYSRQTDSSVASKGRGFSTASALSDLSEMGTRESRIASEASVDSYAFGPSPRSSAADSYAGGYSDASRISGLSMYSDVSSVRDV